MSLKSFLVTVGVKYILKQYLLMEVSWLLLLCLGSVTFGISGVWWLWKE